MLASPPRGPRTRSRLPRGTRRHERREGGRELSSEPTARLEDGDDIAAENAADNVPDAVPLLVPRDGLPPVTDTSTALVAYADALRTGSGPVAVDAERASGYRYGQKAYLVQLRRNGSGTGLIDPVCIIRPHLPHRIRPCSSADPSRAAPPPDPRGARQFARSAAVFAS